MSFSRAATLYAGALALAAVALWFVLAAADTLSVRGGPGVDLRPLVLCIGLSGLSVVSYAVWFSRWNVLAHTNLVFSMIAYVVPIFFLHSLDGLSTAALDLYYQVIAVGFCTCLLGTLVGGALASPATADRLRGLRDFGGAAGDVVARRTQRLLIGCVVVVAACFGVLGFVPALAPDPMAAKFFKGAYAVHYGLISIPYRFSTSVIALLLPLAVMLAVTRRHPRLWMVYLAAIGMLVLGLLRQPAFSGTLLFIGIALARRKRGLFMYFGLLIAAYVSGATLYALLHWLGVGGFAAGSGDVSLLRQIVAGAPDLTDHLDFMISWVGAKEYTHGLTFVGGLVPGNFFWNPAVWSLHVTNPGVPIDQISSGGLRMPAPIWGLVSFGWPGVVCVSFVNGVLVGYLARVFSWVVPDQSLPAAACWMVLYVAIGNVVPLFYNLGYLSVIQLVVVLALLFWKTGTPPARAARPARVPRPRHREAVGSLSSER